MARIRETLVEINPCRAGAVGKKSVEGSEAAHVSAINVAKVHRWFLRQADERVAEEARAVVRRRCGIHPVTEGVAVEAARLRHRRGRGLGDAIVYATVRSLGAFLLTGDPDFRGVEGVARLPPDGKTRGLPWRLPDLRPGLRRRRARGFQELQLFWPALRRPFRKPCAI